MIDTPEKRRSAIDFASGVNGAGMPIPTGTIGLVSRIHALNLYSGILPSSVPHYFWRNKNLITSIWKGQVTPTDGSTQTI